MENIRFGRMAAWVIAALGIPSFAAATQLAANPWFPAYGTSVSVELRDTRWATFLPASRYWRSGNTINLEFEYPSDGFFGPRSDFVNAPIALGELPPGSYTLRAKLFDLSHPAAAPEIFSQQVTVAPPDAAGVYPVPRFPGAFQPVDVVVRNDYHVDPATAKASVSGNVIRIDYDYAVDAPATAPAPAGLAAFASAKVAGLAPGNYRIEGWGRDRSGGLSQLRQSATLQIGTFANVVEYYADSLDHYFMSAWPDEIAMLDAMASPGFKRTGYQFKAWLRASDAPAGASPVCRFYASGPNSHFYTADPGECNYLKGIESKQKSEAQAAGKSFQGWQFEAIAFYAVQATDGQCPGGTQPVYRAYNDRAAQNDSNHRFTVTTQLREAMRSSWADEGVAFCAPT